MKRLTFLTVIAMVTIATSGGCRTCGMPFGLFNRGDACNTCDTGSYGYTGAAYGPDVIYEGDTMLPPVTSEVLPGPRPATQ